MTLSISSAAKSYGTFRVLHDIDFTVHPGEVHALLGPNGAGKSTLIKCIGGVQRFDAGTVTLDGEDFEAASPGDAFDSGIATIHQHLSLIDSLSVSDNIFLGQERRRGPLISRREQHRISQQLLDQFGIDARPSTLLGTLPIGVKQLIEIAKAWHRTSIRVLILDEPTAALTEDETLRLFTEIERMKQAGARIIYTTHRLGEIYRIADRVTVIRDGGVELTRPVSEVTPREVISAIAGRDDVSHTSIVAAAKRITEEIALDVRSLRGPRFGPLDLTVKAGEVVGLYGVLGAGRSSFLETIAGGFAAEGGSVAVAGKALRSTRPGGAIASGIAFVPSDRKKQALWDTLSASDNMLMASYARIATGPFRSSAAERAAFSRTAERLDVQPPDPARDGGSFSGGNQQKIVLGRWLQDENLKVLILDEPTQGVDVGARQKIYETCLELASRGVAVLFASSDADEVVALADRVLVFDQGRPTAEFHGDTITADALLASAHELA